MAKKKKFNPNAIKSEADAKQLLKSVLIPDNIKEVYVSPIGMVYYNKEVAELRAGKGNIHTVKIK